MADPTTIIQAAQKGDVSAYGEIVRRFQDMAYGYAYAILGDSQLAQDAAQEAFIEAYRQLADLKEPKAFPGWLKRIIFKHCDRLTRGKRILTVPLEEAMGEQSQMDGPDANVERMEMKEEVLAAIQSLPDGQRIATTLFYINGYSQSEVADFLEVPVSTVKKRLHDSRRKLKERMLDMVADKLKENAPDERFWYSILERMVDVSRVDELHDLMRTALGDETGWSIGEAPDGRAKKVIPSEWDQDAWLRGEMEKMRSEKGNPEMEIFAPTLGKKMAGVITIFYARANWTDGLVGRVDVLAVAESFRGTGLGMALLKRAATALREASEAHGLSAVGLVSCGEEEGRYCRLWKEVGGDARTDVLFRIFEDDGPGSPILWWPLDDSMKDIDSKSLAWMLWNYGGLPEEGFKILYGDLPIYGLLPM